MTEGVHVLSLPRHGVLLTIIAVVIGMNRATAAAQLSVEAGPLAAYYLALGASKSSDGPNEPGSFSTFAFGGELTAWLHRRWGIHAQVATAPKSGENFVNPGGFEGRSSAQTTLGSLQATYDIDASDPRQFWVAAGPGFVHHGGAAFQSSGSPTEVAAALGIGSSRRINSSLRWSFGASTLVYRYTGILGVIGGPPRPDGTVATGERVHRLRSDLLFHISLTWNGH